MEKVCVPESELGDCRIERFSVSPMEAALAFRDRILPGEYTRLMIHGRVIMSDTPKEMSDHRAFVRLARGDVLINGLGLGMVVKNILPKPEVASITVNEINPNVIALVAPCYDSDKITINQTDCREWKAKGQKFDAIWHDIWGDVSTDDLADMTYLKRKYARRLKPGGFQGCWMEEFLRRQKRRR